MWPQILTVAMLGFAAAAGAQSVIVLRHPEPELSEVKMSKAMKDARASFPLFVDELRDSPWDAVSDGAGVVTELSPDNPGNDDCCHQIEVLVPVGPGFVTAWTTNISITDNDQFEATLQHAVGIAGLNAGDRISFGALHVADWRYSLYEQTYGDYRNRAQMDPPPVGEFLVGDYAPLPEMD